MTSVVSCADLSARAFDRRVADPEQFSGGGSVAALVAAHACALVELIAHLALRRRVNATHADAIQTGLIRLASLASFFYSAADEDLVVLDQLLSAQRGQKHGRPRAEFVQALERAAESPLGVAERCVELLDTVASLAPLASRFTVSDVAAAAALGAGAGRAAIFTVDVNVTLLRDESSYDRGRLTALEERVSKAANLLTVLEQRASNVADAALAKNRHA